MNLQEILRNGLGWGALLWLFGYLLGFLFYALVPAERIGWYVGPIGLAVTVFVLWKWVKLRNLAAGLGIGLIWTALAVGLDYAFIVKLLAPAGGYYKPDVYLYYASTLLLPILAAALGSRGGKA